MAHKEVFVCDVCGVERKEANHWFVAALPDVPDNPIRFWRWPNCAKAAGVTHICGQICAHKMLDQFLSGESL